MDTVRKPFQGVFNIVRFNWHFYVIASIVVLLAATLLFVFPSPFGAFAGIFGLVLLITTSFSLIVSFYVYDLSGLYELNWLQPIDPNDKILNIHAGFDETSELISSMFPNNKVTVFDFYDPQRHTEISIKRARNAYGLYPDTQSIQTSQIPLPDETADKALLILSAHEIRDTEERALFFKELNRVLKADGEIVVVEHLRDTMNFLAYNIGFLHFHSESTWLDSFEAANFEVAEKRKITPFITKFKLKKNGSSS